MQDKNPTQQKLTTWTEEELQDAQALLNTLDEYSYLKFFLQVISVFIVGKLLDILFSLPSIVNLIGLNTVFMAASCFSIRTFFEREIRNIIKSKSLKDCLFADTQLLHGNIESLTDYKMLFLKKDTRSFKRYLEELSKELALLAQENELQKHQKSAALRVFYKKLKKIDEQRPYTSYFYNLLMRQPQRALSAMDIKNILKIAIECGDNSLILEISSDIKNDNLPVSLAENESLIDTLNQIGEQNKALFTLLGTNNIIGLNSDASFKPAQGFPLLDRCAQLSYFINFSLIEPVREIQQSLQTYHQLGFLIFASGVFLTVPMGFLVGVLALVFVVTQSLELSIRALLAKHSLQEIVDVYSKQPSPHYERLLELKIKSLMTPKSHASSHGASSPLILTSMGEVQCFKLYTIILDNHALLRSKKSGKKQPLLDLNAILPLLLRLKTPAQLNMYLDKLRPLSADEQLELLTKLDTEYLTPLREQIVNKEKELQFYHSKKDNIEKRWESFLLSLNTDEKQEEPLEEVKQALQKYWTDQATEKQVQSLNLTQEQYKRCLELMALKDNLIIPQPTVKELLHQREDLETLKQQINVLPKTPSDLKPSTQDTYDHLCKMRNMRDNMMSYVFPINKINSSILGVLFYFLPMLLTISVMAYTVVPLAVFTASVLAVFCSYQYLKAVENRDLDKLSLADFFGQPSSNLHLKLSHEKIARLQQKATPQEVGLELAGLLKTIDAQPLRVCDKQFVEHIYTSLNQLVLYKGSPYSREILTKLAARINLSDESLHAAQAMEHPAIESEYQGDIDILRQSLKDIKCLISIESDDKLLALGEQLTKIYHALQKNYPQEKLLFDELDSAQKQWQQRIGVDDSAVTWPPTVLIPNKEEEIKKSIYSHKVTKQT